MFGDQPVEEVAVVWEAAVVVVVAGPEDVEVADGVAVDEGAVVVALTRLASRIPPLPASCVG